MTPVRAVVIDPDGPGRLGFAHVDAPKPTPGQAVVRVAATSLNRGDLLAAQVAEVGWRPGHDVAGTVVQAASDGTGPARGTRVVGLLDDGAWAEQVAVATDRLAQIPDEVSFAEAATLPTAGLTAHRAVEKAGSLLGKRVLVTGSTGGVGLFAHQLATRSGAFVVGVARSQARVDAVRDLGADEIVVGDSLTGAGEYGPYDLIVESLGGTALSQGLGLLAPGGVCVSLGWSASPSVELDLRQFLAVGGGTLYGLRMYHELTIRPASSDLELLARMVADRRLRIPIQTQGGLDDLGTIAQQLLDRTYTGKAVLLLE